MKHVDSTMLGALALLPHIYVGQAGQLRAKRSPEEHQRRLAAAQAKRERKAAKRMERQVGHAHHSL